MPSIKKCRNWRTMRRHSRRLRRRGRSRWRALREDARALLGEYGVDVYPQTRAKGLGVEQRQFVEIARALSFGARLIILDEPTAQLDAGGIDRLFTKLLELRRQGVAFLFISHHLQEVYDLCDTVPVFRDARHVLTAPVADLPKEDLVAAMTGDGEGAAEGDSRAAVRAPVRAPAPARKGDPGAEAGTEST